MDIPGPRPELWPAGEHPAEADMTEAQQSPTVSLEANFDDELC